MKLTKNLVIVASGFWTRCLIKKIYFQMFGVTRPPSYLFACIRILIDPSPTLSANVVIQCPPILKTSKDNIKKSNRLYLFKNLFCLHSSQE